jgi:hypothetical protein
MFGSERKREEKQTNIIKLAVCLSIYSIKNSSKRYLSGCMLKKGIRIVHAIK